IVGRPLALKDFKIEAVSGGSDAQGEVVVFVIDDVSKATVRGQATSTDVFEATLRALVNAVNRVQAAQAEK
ncbi:MAG: 2-isopropylmalate synthase, partial [Thermoguttaceae bacterium]|nr:2-isopropylmalate synthase [Thermoguttaceae bacterium]